MAELTAEGVAGRLSIIIPAYNYGHFIGACLRSVIAQHLDDLELIVVDDGSQDDTAAVVRRFDGVTCIRQSNLGLSAARNTGILASTGEYVLFLDADDQLPPHTLGPRLQFLRARPACAITVCRNRYFTTVAADSRPRLAGRWHLPPTALATRLLYFNIAPPHAFLLRRRVLAAVGLFDTNLRACEDYDYWLRALTQGHAPVYCPVGSVLYRRHAASMSANRRNQLEHDVVLHERVLQLLLQARSLPVANTLLALLAAYAGVFTTLARLASGNPAMVTRLVQTIDDSLPLIGRFAEPQTAAPDLLAHLFLLQLLAQSRQAAALIAGAGARGRAVVDTLAAAFELPLARPRDCYTAAARALLTDAGAAFIDRYRLLKLLTTSLLAPAAAAL